MRCMQQIREQKSDELERHGYRRVPDKGEEGADWQAVDVDFVRVVGARGENCGFPVGGSGIGSGGFVGL